MLETIHLSAPIKDAIKVIVGIKVLSFIVVSGISSLQQIREMEDNNRCVVHMTERFESEQEEHLDAHAKAVHFCNGGKAIK